MHLLKLDLRYPIAGRRCDADTVSITRCGQLVSLFLSARVVGRLTSIQYETPS